MIKNLYFNAFTVVAIGSVCKICHADMKYDESISSAVLTALCEIKQHNISQDY